MSIPGQPVGDHNLLGAVAQRGKVRIEELHLDHRGVAAPERDEPFDLGAAGQRRQPGLCNLADGEEDRKRCPRLGEPTERTGPGVNFVTQLGSCDGWTAHLPVCGCRISVLGPPARLGRSETFGGSCDTVRSAPEGCHRRGQQAAAGDRYTQWSGDCEHTDWYEFEGDSLPAGPTDRRRDGRYRCLVVPVRSVPGRWA